MSMNVIAPTVIMDGVSLVGSVNSIPVSILYSDNVGIQIVWAGTPTGTFGIQVSNTATISPTGVISGGTWSTLTGSYPSAAGTASNGFISLTNVCAAFVRLTYTLGSSTGTVTATLVAKPI